MGLGAFWVSVPRLTQASAADQAELSALCLLSKAHWDFDADFMAACVNALTVKAPHLSDFCAVTRGGDGRFSGYLRLLVDGPIACLDKLFVDPAAMGQGLGRDLMSWAIAQARVAGAARMVNVSDPSAAPFYERMGAVRQGTVLPRQFEVALCRGLCCTCKTAMLPDPDPSVMIAPEGDPDAQISCCAG